MGETGIGEPSEPSLPSPAPVGPGVANTNHQIPPLARLRPVVEETQVDAEENKAKQEQAEALKAEYLKVARFVACLRCWANV